MSPARDLPEGAAVIVLGPGGRALAESLRPRLPGADVHGLKGRAAEGADVVFADTVPHLQSLFGAGRPIVGVCAAGILIRALAPLLSDKRREPPVVAVAEDGSAAVPLLGGHRGANRLALAVAEAVGGRAALTTAGDVSLGLALDDPPAGWHVANPETAKGVVARLLAGAPVALAVEAGDAGWIAESAATITDDAPVAIRVTDRVVTDPGEDLVLHPPSLALGVGCERGAGADELIELAETTLTGAGLSPLSVACVVSIDLKADEGAVLALADHLGVPARFFGAETLEAETPRLANPSDRVFRDVGCHGVAEGAALAAVGPDGALVVEKRKSRRCTAALARAPGDIDPAAVGRARGRLDVVGIGPGAEDWRTPEATAALGMADDVVGYGLYLDLVGDLVRGKALHASDLGDEETRVRAALDLAASGRRVALVGSGDAGVYALAALVFELLEAEGDPARTRIAIAVVPGVSAMQAAAARVGAPLGHDFCAISLSDLLTPMADIERRLEAAAEGDFVVALYNPVSRRRKAALARARDILLAHRPPETPVVLARNLGRAGETVETVALRDLAPGMADMLTVVLVGSSRTRAFDAGERRWVYTPRGYAEKREAKHREKQEAGE